MIRLMTCTQASYAAVARARDNGCNKSTNGKAGGTGPAGERLGDSNSGCQTELACQLSAAMLPTGHVASVMSVRTDTWPCENTSVMALTSR